VETVLMNEGMNADSGQPLLWEDYIQNAGQ